MEMQKQPQNVEEMVKKYCHIQQHKPKNHHHVNNELEVVFGSKIRLTRVDFENVIGLLKSQGFQPKSSKGDYMMRVNILHSNIRVEIKGLSEIQQLHQDTNCLETLNKKNVKYIEKSFYDDFSKLDVDEYNFSVTIKKEINLHENKIKEFHQHKWSESKKRCRFINRLSFTHVDYNVTVDMSIVKSSESFKKSNCIQNTGVFESSEKYEIEIEVTNSTLDTTLIHKSLQKLIKFVLCGLQQSNFPISLSEMIRVRKSYCDMIWPNEEQSTFTKKKHFIGPSSITLQQIHLVQNDIQSKSNILHNYVVTEKADGQRVLLYIHEDGKIYFINNSMNIIFSGAIVNHSNTLLDGEWIKYDKKNDFINLFAAFDIYYENGKDVRAEKFMDFNENMCRYKRLCRIMNDLKQNCSSIISNHVPCPIMLEVKKFYPEHKDQSILKDGCQVILQQEKNDLFMYSIDGLIFTHCEFGVGSNKIGEAGEKKNVTWPYSFKWKPEKYNTIDFLVTDIEPTIYNNHHDNEHEDENKNKEEEKKEEEKKEEEKKEEEKTTTIQEYKWIELRCGFSEKDHGFMNPFYDVIHNNVLLKEKQYQEKINQDYKPCRFYPTEPNDINAGLTKIKVRLDDFGEYQMYSEESDEIFPSNTIVEFRYDKTDINGFQWKPLRIRYDKTADFNRHLKEYGNSYTTANSNWKSIHFPITEQMITGEELVENVVETNEKYYHQHDSFFLETISLKKFHNFIKQQLLTKVCDGSSTTLIDLACGKAGDIHKWIHSNLHYVVGIDKNEDNIQNQMDGACSRYLKLKSSSSFKKMKTNILFVCGDCGKNIKNGKAFMNYDNQELYKDIVDVVMNGSHKKIGKGVELFQDIGSSGFHITSCQFALHYFFKDLTTLTQFVKNVSECTKLGGYFIGTTYDGKKIFQLLKNDSCVEIKSSTHPDKTVWKITKLYHHHGFRDDSSSLGYEIKVFQESIHQEISEYLVNFSFFIEIMRQYGFQIYTSQTSSFQKGIGSFEELYHLLDDCVMTQKEKQISFLNNYFIFKKITNVNSDFVFIENKNKNENENEKDIDKEPIENKKTVFVKLYKKIVIRSVI
jgi:hypothetical protein